MGSTLREVFRVSAEPASKLVKLILELALFAFEFSIQNVNDPLMQVPEVIQLQSYIVIHGPSCPCRSYRR